MNRLNRFLTFRDAILEALDDGPSGFFGIMGHVLNCHVELNLGYLDSYPSYPEIQRVVHEELEALADDGLVQCVDGQWRREDPTNSAMRTIHDIIINELQGVDGSWCEYPALKDAVMRHASMQQLLRDDGYGKACLLLRQALEDAVESGVMTRVGSAYALSPEHDDEDDPASIYEVFKDPNAPFGVATRLYRRHVPEPVWASCGAHDAHQHVIIDVVAFNRGLQVHGHRGPWLAAVTAREVRSAVDAPFWSVTVTPCNAGVDSICKLHACFKRLFGHVAATVSSLDELGVVQLNYRFPLGSIEKYIIQPTSFPSCIDTTFDVCSCM